MWDFLIVLGLIPGTNVQITFNELLYTLVFTFIAYMLLKQRAQLRKQINTFMNLLRKEIKSTKRSMHRRRKSGAKLLKAYKRRAKAKVSIKKLRGTPAAKLHTQKRAA